MRYKYTTEDTCSQAIEFDIENDIVTNISFSGGCNGNLKAISKILDGWTVLDIEQKCKGILCGRRPTSCSDQLAKAVKQAYNVTHKE